MLNLVGVNAKIYRAQTSLLALESEISRYCTDRVDKVRKEVPNSEYGVAFPQNQPSDIPIDWSVMVGEICYNLRSSLDHLIWQLVIDNEQNPTRRNQFPIVYDQTKYDEVVEDRLSGVGDRARDLIRAVQPFQENGNTGSYLSTLNNICNIDKHRHLNLVGRYSNIDAHLEGQVVSGLLPDGFSGGLSLYQYLKGTGHEGKIVLDVDLEVCLLYEDLRMTETPEQIATNHPVPYPTVISTLSGCLASVEAIVWQIAAGA